MGAQLVIEDALMYLDFTSYPIELQRIVLMISIWKCIMTTKMNFYSTPNKMDTISKCLNKFLHYH
uniref:Uncharacterized protein n=1 Tax=Arundo donax TaxID=35708 RepID=A0A0A9CFJ2_ARUDO